MSGLWKRLPTIVVLVRYEAAIIIIPLARALQQPTAMASIRSITTTM